MAAVRSPRPAARDFSDRGLRIADREP